jgi:uncharacterized membrane protein YcaP (DUF421 family)
VATIAFWDFIIDWASFRFPALKRLGHAAPLQLIHDGRLLRRNLRKELVTLEELQGHLRKEGIDDIAKVKDAYMEGDGKISIVRAD